MLAKFHCQLHPYILAVSTLLRTLPYSQCVPLYFFFRAFHNDDHFLFNAIYGMTICWRGIFCDKSSACCQNTPQYRWQSGANNLRNTFYLKFQHRLPTSSSSSVNPPRRCFTSASTWKTAWTSPHLHKTCLSAQPHRKLGNLSPRSRSIHWYA